MSEIPKAEGQHLTQVLRLRNGEPIEAIDGKGNRVKGNLVIKDYGYFIEASADIETINEIELTVPPIVLEIAVLKGEAMEWVIEKCVELGVRKVVPLETSFTVVQTEKKGRDVFQSRWQRIADQALKQCGRLSSLEVAEPIRLETYIQNNPASVQSPRFFAAERSKDTAPELLTRLRYLEPNTESLHILIGPEGGFSFEEIEFLSKQANPVSLGPLILRAETAAIMSASLATSFFRTQILTK